MIYTKTILVAPLNWGLGHATRCIPVINELIDRNHKVIIASDGIALLLLQKEFPQLTSEELPSYNITYPKDDQFVNHILKSTPKIWKAIREEKKVLDQLIRKYDIDIVISDNRYGLFNKRRKSIIITHQIKILTPTWSNLISALHAYFLNRFNEIWIPDYSGNINISGALSHGKKQLLKSKFIGPLSRFKTSQRIESPIFDISQPFILAIISGPEPQRTLFEKMLLDQFSKINQPIVMVGGNPNSKIESTFKHITHFPLLTSSDLRWLLENAQTCISRSGYSSIMDFVALQKSAILIPTPGQLEQMYLAQYLDDRKLFVSIKQDEFNIENALSKFSHFKPSLSVFSKLNSTELCQALNNI